MLAMDHKIESSELDTGAAVPSAVAQIVFKQENNDERDIVNQPLIYQVENRKEQTCLPLLDTGMLTDRGVSEEKMHSDVKLTVVNYDGWITSFVQQLSKLWEDQKLCDLRITTHDGAAILVHSCVVAVRSKAICSFLTQDSTPHTIKDITISCLDQSMLMIVLQFIYAGTVSINASRLSGLLDAAELLEIEHLIHVCKDLQKHLADLDKAGPIESNVVYTLQQDQVHSQVKVEETVGKRKRGRPRKCQQNNNTTDKKKLPSLHKCHNKPDLSSEKLIFRQISKICGGSQDHIPEFLPAEPVKVSTARKLGRPRKNPTPRVKTPSSCGTDNKQAAPSGEDPTETHQDITELPMKASENCVELLHDENHEQLVDQSSDIVEATKALSDQPREHACVICNRVFSNRKKLNNHMSRDLHVTPQSLVCPTCGKQMPSRQHLLKHERSHLPSLFVKCGKCSKTFRNESSLRKHCTYAHPSDAMQIPLLPCCHCGKAFTRANVLRRHEVACSGKRPYKCKKCDQSFGHHNVLRHHMLTHESICKYECSFCFRAFNRSDNLKVHMRKHTGEKPYLCTLCGQQFRHNVTLKGHINSIHQDKSLSDLGLTPVEKGKPREGGYARRKYVSDISGLIESSSQSGNSRSHTAPLIQEEQQDTVSDQAQYVDGHFPVVMVRFKEDPPGNRAVYEDVFPEPLEDNTILPQYVQPDVHNETLPAGDPQHHQGNGQLQIL